MSDQIRVNCNTNMNMNMDMNMNVDVDMNIDEGSFKSHQASHFATSDRIKICGVEKKLVSKDNFKPFLIKKKGAIPGIFNIHFVFL